MLNDLPSRTTILPYTTLFRSLRDLQRKLDLTYMFISHDLRVVASLASHRSEEHTSELQSPCNLVSRRPLDTKHHEREIRRTVPAECRDPTRMPSTAEEIRYTT